MTDHLSFKYTIAYLSYQPIHGHMHGPPLYKSLHVARLIFPEQNVSTSAREIMGVNMNWDTTSYTQTEFAANHSLPCLVRLVSERGEAAPESCLGNLVDVSKNFLAYSHRRRTKAYAQHMVWDPDSNSYSPDGLLIEVPKDYPGFFEIVPDNPHKSVDHHRSIQDVVSARCSQFLVKTLTGGFRTKETSSGKLEISSKHIIYPGEVLNVVKTVTKRWELTHSGSKNAESQYLQCVDSSGEEVCIPLIHPGIFCAIYDDVASSSNFVWTMNDLLARFDFPMTVRLAFGWPPTLPRGNRFSGVLRLIEKRRPETLVLYSFEKGTDVVVELPFDMKVKLQSVTNQADVEKEETYIEATKESDSAVYFYIVGMKTVQINYRNNLRNDVRIDTISRAGAQLTRGLLANAQDMKTFSSQDFYPPLRNTNKDSSWPITFTDTTAETREEEAYFEHDDTEENDDDEGGKESEKQDSPSKNQSKTALSRTKSLAGHSKTDALRNIVKDGRVPTCENTTRSKLLELDRREAHC